MNDRSEELKKITVRKIREDTEWANGEPMPQHVKDYWNDILELIEQNRRTVPSDDEYKRAYKEFAWVNDHCKSDQYEHHQVDICIAFATFEKMRIALTKMQKPTESCEWCKGVKRIEIMALSVFTDDTLPEKESKQHTKKKSKFCPNCGKALGNSEVTDA